VSPRRYPRLRTWLIPFALLLAASHLLRALRGRPDFIETGSFLHAVELPLFDRSGPFDRTSDHGTYPESVKIVLEEFGPRWPDENRSGEVERRLPVVLLHGSPGRRNDLAGMALVLGRKRVTMRPDLPGFGRSTRHLPDYSIFAHARYVRALCDELGIERFHVVGFSMGGGVAIALADLCPDRVASVGLLASIGVQELELLGDYHLNHLVHRLQFALVWSLHELVPHFGLLDQVLLSVEYARNFIDTDQRALRGMLEVWAGPMSILHGTTDALVPIAAALEHERIVPQSDLALFGGGHFIPFLEAEAAGAHLDEFFDRVEAGAAPTRSTATRDRVARAQAPFDPLAVPAVAGFGLLFFGLLIVLATLVSEDLTCIAVGALVGQGRIGFVAGVSACVLGIYIGDLLLFLAGRWVGRRALHRAPLKWILSEQRVLRSSVWLERRGPLVIFLSRFMPGARLPTYFASGILHTSFLRFSLWFALAALLWTPILVWLSGRIEGALTDRVELLQDNLALALLVTLATVFLLVKVVLPLLSRRGRRRMIGRWKRWRHYEFWPVWLFYVPIAAYCAWRALIERKLLAFTAANPAIPHGGVIGESKGRILELLEASAGDALLCFVTLPETSTGPERIARARCFLEENGLDYPVVLKPDVGERGAGVQVLEDHAALEAALCAEGSEASRGAWILQEFCPGVEFGLFYARRPDRDTGELFSITKKELPRVVGDGRRTLEDLILYDGRTVAQSDFLLEKNRERLEWVAPRGEVVLLGDIGSHCRGTRFSSGEQIRTPRLEEELDRIARSIPGFYFGRFDIKSPGVEELRAGSFRILELNGVTSEAGEAYDPDGHVLRAWATIASQWRRAYAIGAMNARRGARVSGVFELLSLLFRKRP